MFGESSFHEDLDEFEVGPYGQSLTKRGTGKSKGKTRSIKLKQSSSDVETFLECKASYIISEIKHLRRGVKE